MFPYLLNIAITIVLVILARQSRSKKYRVSVPGVQEDGYFNYNILWLILISWVLLYTFKGTTGTDAWGYHMNYKRVFYLNYSFRQSFFNGRDKLYQISEWLLSHYSHGSWVWGCAGFSLILYIPVQYVIRKKSINPGFSVLLYIFTMSFYLGFNGLRQALSMGFACIAFYCFLQQKKYRGYATVMLVAFLFHSAAMLIVPFHFVMLQKWESEKKTLLLLGFVLVYIFLAQLWGGIIGTMDMVGQDKFAADYANLASNSGRGSFLRVLVDGAVFVFALKNYSLLKARFKDFDIDMWVFLLTFLMTLSIRKFVYFGRIGSYISLGMMLSLPKLAYAFGFQNKKAMNFAIGVMYFFYMISLLLHGDSNLYPYKPVWESGYY